MVDAHHRHHLVGASSSFGSVDLAQAQTVLGVLTNRHVRPQRIALEDQAHVATLGRNEHPAVDRVQYPIVDGYRTGRRLFETGDHPQRRGLAAAGGAEHAHEVTVVDRQIQVIDGTRRASGVSLGDAAQRDRGHRSST
jgi:hypothetical protein